MTNSSPLVGAVLFAWLPDDQRPGVPGAKFRPVLIVDADVANKRLVVAYGTSQRTDRCNRGEIVFRKEDVPGLAKDTKFCLWKTKVIPISPEYLSRDQSSGGLAVLGRVPAKLSSVLLARLQEVTNIN